MKIYLDVCCLNRPFDDLAAGRVAVEATAVARLIELIETGELEDFSSEMAMVEIGRNADVDRRRKVSALLPPRERIMGLDDDVLDSAEKLMDMGFGLADAVHLSAARAWKVDVFLTVDDKLLKRGKKLSGKLGVRVVDPVTFLKEIE